MRLIIKIGTNLVTNPDNTLNTTFLKSIVDQLAQLHQKKHQVLLVTSGAVACGRSEVNIHKERKNIPFRQALAAVGQPILMDKYHDYFQKHKISIAQVLLTENDFLNRSNFLNTRNSLNLLLSLNTIPIINENDVTETAELKISDNDTLAAKLAGMINADLLILLTNVAGLYTKNPQTGRNAKLITTVKKIDQSVIAKAKGSVSPKSLGGMLSKIKAAKYAVTSGVNTIIASGQKDAVLKIVLKKQKIGTFFPAETTSEENRKKWLKPKRLPDAVITIDTGAENALLNKGSSLLPSGIVTVTGLFQRGDVVNINNLENKIIAFGQVNYDSLTLDKIKGLKSNEITKILENKYEEEVIHRDNMVLGE